MPTAFPRGTLCLIDRRPRNLAAADLAILEDLAQMAESELKGFQLSVILVFLELDGLKALNDGWDTPPVTA